MTKITIPAPKRSTKTYLNDNGVNSIRVKGVGFEDIRAWLLRLPDTVTEQSANRLEVIGVEAVESIRNTIDTANTATGQAEGRQGRNKTFEMRRKVTFQVRRNKRSTSLRVGWLDGRPGYAWFQEHGTSNGIEGMKSIEKAQYETEDKLRDFF